MIVVVAVVVVVVVVSTVVAHGVLHHSLHPRLQQAADQGKPTPANIADKEVAGPSRRGAAKLWRPAFPANSWAEHLGNLKGTMRPIAMIAMVTRIKAST